MYGILCLKETIFGLSVAALPHSIGIEISMPHAFVQAHQCILD